jgi:gluconolactonase
VRILLAALLLPAAAAAQDPPRGNPAILAPDARLERVFAGGVFLEGPAVSPDGAVYFSDITSPDATGLQVGHIWRYDPRSGATVIFRSPSGQSNGIEFDAAGRMVVVEGANAGGRRVTRTDMASGRSVALALQFRGRPFNSPNDLTIDEAGRIFFTDPRYVGPEPLEQPVMGVYRIDPDGTVSLVIADAGKPNGIVVSPDQRTLYVAADDNGASGGLPAGVEPRPGIRALLAYDLVPDGAARFRSVLVDFAPGSGPDGIAVDVDGNIYAALPDGVRVFSPAGDELAVIPVPEVPSNIAFGRGAEARTLFITARTGLYRLPLRKAGYHLPRVTS